MVYTGKYIEDKIKQAIKIYYIEVNDLSDGCGMKFEAVIVSPEFEGKSFLARHRQINSILEEELKAIHALTLKTVTPQQWESRQK